MKPVSIILSHWGQHEERSQAMRKCLTSLIETTKHLPVEIIIGDNGGNESDSEFLFNLVKEKKIQHYFKNSENLYFGFCRNVGFDISAGDYVVFSDNDIEYKPGWLEWCVNVLTCIQGKYLVTPLRTDRQHRQEKYWCGTVFLEQEELLLNWRAGSNCWMMKREDFDVMGRFRNHPIAGTHWTNACSTHGYKMITKEKNSLAVDIGFKKGYAVNERPKIAKKLANGEEIIINS